MPDEIKMLASLKLEVNALNDADVTRAKEKLNLAKSYVSSATTGFTVADEIVADCIVSVAADLYNAKNAQLGVMNVTDTDMSTFRVSTDPLRSAWPKLNAAGIPTGGVTVA